MRLQVLHALFMDHDFLNQEKLVAWRDMIQGLGAHLVARYGAATHQWFFEHWNECAPRQQPPFPNSSPCPSTRPLARSAFLPLPCLPAIFSSSAI